MFTNPVEWSVSASNVEGNIWRITVTGDIAPEYHIYDTAEYAYGANSTVISFECDSNATLAGGLEVLSPVQRNADEILGFEVGTISGKAQFCQDVQLNGKGSDVQVTVEWMACTDTACTPPDDVTMTVHIGKEASSAAYYAGIACGFVTAAALVALGLYFAKKRNK